MSNVTSEDFAARLLRSAQQAAAIMAGEIEPPRRTRRKVIRTGEADEIEVIQDQVQATKSRRDR
jgi:hypothetical protein